MRCAARAATTPSSVRWARELIERQVEPPGPRCVDDLLDVSRITRGKVALQRERARRCADVVRGAVETSRAG